MNRIYGKQMRPKFTARSKRPSSRNPLATARTNHGIATCAATVRMIRAVVSHEKVFRANSAASYLLESDLEKIGTNAALMVPSANRRLNRLGNEKAT